MNRPRLRMLAMALAVLLPATALVAQSPPAAAAEPPTRTLDGSVVDWQALRSRAVLVAFFSLRMHGALDCLRVYQQLHSERRSANLEVLAVCVDTGRDRELRALLAEHRLTLPVAVDGDGRLQREFQPQSMPHAWCFAEQGRCLGDLPGFPASGWPSPAALYANLLRRALGMDVAIENDPAETPWPPMPAFALPAGGPDHQALRGRPYVFAFVAADCERCRAQLELFRALHAEFADTGLAWVCVLVGDTDPAAFAAERRLPFAVYRDADSALRRTLHYRGFVPDTMLVDADGRIRFRHVAYDDEQPALYRMELRALLGRPNPPILKAHGPSGVRRCMICHEREYFDWRASGHAHALRSLQAIGRAEDADCVRCHVVGWQQPGGYDADDGARAPLLGDVQCESCHDNGGPHLAGAERAAPARVTATACANCHDADHSLGFDFERFVHIVDHRTDLLTATPAERAAVRHQRDALRRALLMPDGEHVGAAACKACHPTQHANWATSPHAHAFELLAADRQRDAACTTCHATGIDRPWANDNDGDASRSTTHGVQCESCHGPGQRHVAAASPAERRATITGLGARCEECVVRQICSNCHDQANDPEFDFARALAPVRARCRPPQGDSRR